MKFNGIIENKLRVIEEKLAEIRNWDIGTFEYMMINTSTIAVYADLQKSYSGPGI